MAGYYVECDICGVKVRFPFIGARITEDSDGNLRVVPSCPSCESVYDFDLDPAPFNEGMRSGSKVHPLPAPDAPSEPEDDDPADGWKRG